MKKVECEGGTAKSVCADKALPHYRAGPPIIHLRARGEARLQGVLDFQYIVFRREQWQRSKQTLYMRPE
ncbi:hypothetical protein FACS1894109_00390 [Spirochaetia bacterium]|nr:hypothetical protein FACS1894109_00390 [Spirochaetia bacterium]